MRSHGGRADPSPVLDFLATIQAKERIPGGAGAFAILDDADRATLVGLLRGYHHGGLTPALERRARTFLISYREMNKHAGVLDAAERARLDQILDESPGLPAARPTKRGSGISWRILSAVLAVLMFIGLRVGIASFVSSHQSGPPPTSAGGRPPAKHVPLGATDLQNLERDYGPWVQLAPSEQRPQTASPALLLLEYGSYLASEKWTVSPGAPGWQRDLGDNVAVIEVNGGYADISDTDGNPYVVGINQPFIISSNPGTVLMINRAGTVVSMSLAHATAVRHSLGK